MCQPPPCLHHSNWNNHKALPKSKRNYNALFSSSFYHCVVGKLCKTCTCFIHSLRRRALEHCKNAVRKGTETRIEIKLGLTAARKVQPWQRLIRCFLEADFLNIFPGIHDTQRSEQLIWEKITEQYSYLFSAFSLAFEGRNWRTAHFYSAIGTSYKSEIPHMLQI